MKAKDIEATYTIASATGRLIGDIVGSPALGAMIVSSVLQPGEKPTEKNIRLRLREALSAGTLQVKGLGPKGMIRLQSALSLGKVLFVDAPYVGTVIDNPSVAAKAFSDIAWEPVEKLAVLSLDVRYRILSTRIVSSGTAKETLAFPADIFRWVIQTSGVSCIVAHNHPSGQCEPSENDIALTRQLIQAGKLLAIPLQDHLVVSGDGYISLRQSTDLWSSD